MFLACDDFLLGTAILFVLLIVAGACALFFCKFYSFERLPAGINIPFVTAALALVEVFAAFGAKALAVLSAQVL